ncbi:rhomboid family intramembrane serine protease [Novosphingobium kaempferiae]|uniref:rhomboid family intramembrane serine protease n=1 Tax=Novosphingobium kaempferiae TaxID=2896849 RepID=UPI001E6402CE|nr:rhomboid family intramembrane serine protease [Novosphingobium kaempferiae]
MTTATQSCAQSPAAEDEEDAKVFWHDHVPGAILLVAMTIPFVWMFTKSDGMLEWAISRKRLSAGLWAPLQLHMFAHGSVIHILMNGSALVAVSGAIVHRLGSGLGAWLRYLILFEVCGLFGAVAFLCIHQWSSVPMLGASGAIYGLVGFLVRIPKDDNNLVPIWSSDMFRVLVEQVKEHLWLFLQFGLLPLLLGRSGGLAWEAHLGGFCAGLALAPYLRRKPL